MKQLAKRFPLICSSPNTAGVGAAAGAGTSLQQYFLQPIWSSAVNHTHSYWVLVCAEIIILSLLLSPLSIEFWREHSLVMGPKLTL